MDELLFRNRNQAYGAFLLRRKYPRVLMFSTLFTSGVFIVLMLLYVYWPEPKAVIDPDAYYIVDVNANGYINKPQAHVPPPSGGFYKHQQIPQVVDSVPISDTLINQADGNGTDTTGSGNGNGSGDGGGPVYMAAQLSPSFPGGDKERTRFLQQNIIYPPAARQKKIQGIVYVSFIVEKNGEITRAKILKGIGYGCDEEALRVINSMPLWNPGKQNGTPVRVQVVIPLHFVWQAV